MARRAGLMSTPTIRSAPTMHDVQPDAPQPEHHYLAPRLHLRRVDHRANARRHPAPDVTDLVEGSVLPDLRHRDLWQHRELGEGGRAHVVVDDLLPQPE